LLDRFGRRHVYLRLAVTDRCNLSCAYCRPVGCNIAGRKAAALPADHLVRLARVFASLGVRKVRLTGGEPTVRPDIVEVARRIKGVPGIETLALTTNGVNLQGLALPLRDAGVEKLNVSLDSLKRDRFAAITGRDLLPAVLKGLEAALNAGFEPLKLNTVVMGGINDDELLDFAELAREGAVNIRFIEYMPFRENGWNRSNFVSHLQMMETLGRVHRLQPIGRGERTGGVAKDFSIEGFRGHVSFITPLSDSFCDRCNRLRVTAEGRLKTCLFAPADVDLAAALGRGASDKALERMIRDALTRKPERHPNAEDLPGCQDLAMNEIGG